MHAENARRNVALIASCNIRFERAYIDKTRLAFSE